MSLSPEQIRPPVVAGTFYPDEPDDCLRDVADLFGRVPVFAGDAKWLGALIPHAGWICSGQVAVGGIATLRQARPDADLVVVFGAVHTLADLEVAAFDEHAQWALPTGMSAVAMEFQRKLVADSPRFAVVSRAHRREHAIEVELPFIQQAWPKAQILPVEISPVDEAAAIGAELARRVTQAGYKPVFLASSDLTHYGPDYDFAPAGEGTRGIHWAMENDRRLLNLVKHLAADQVVAETQANGNACGGGALAAMLGACRELGASAGHVLEHTNSYEVLLRTLGRQRPDNAVGYASAVVG